MTIYRKSLILLFKIEETYGTDPTPTGSANAIAASNVRLSPMEGQDVDRALELARMTNPGTLPADLHQALSFEVELEPAGTAGTAPAWGPLLRACGCAQTISADTSVTYNPISTGFESGAFYFYLGSTLWKGLGARGNCTIRVNASGIPMLVFEFRMLWLAPAEDTRPTPDYNNFKTPKVASKANTPTFTIGGTARALRSLELNLGNQVEGRFLIGKEEIIISDKQASLATTIEAVAVSALNPWALAAAGTTQAIVLAHRAEAGRIATLNVAKALPQRPTSLEEQQRIIEWPLRWLPMETSGNDDWTLVLT